MTDGQDNHLDLIVDGLTNSIRQVSNGQTFETNLLLITSADLKVIIKKNGWRFLWSLEFNNKDRFVFKLVKTKDPNIIQGLISLSDMKGYVYVHLAESSPINFGSNKLYEGVGGNLFAFACKRSWDEGNEGFISFQAKTKLIPHYEKVLGAVHTGGHNMIIYPQEALFLIKQYFKV